MSGEHRMARLKTQRPYALACPGAVAPLLLPPLPAPPLPLPPAQQLLALPLGQVMQRAPGCRMSQRAPMSQQLRVEVPVL